MIRGAKLGARRAGSKHSEETIDAVRLMIREAALELIPLRGVADKLALMPADTTVTVTCSPKLGLDRTIDVVAAAAAEGHRVVPHLAARQVSDEQQLRDIVRELGGIGITDLYVIGGDAPEPAGIYPSAGTLLKALDAMSHPFTRIGVGCYPEGHPGIAADVLMSELRLKQDYSTYMVSQLCFEATTLVAWLRHVRALGITLPLRIGLAAPMNMLKLADLSLKIGVGTSVRYLTKQHGLVSNLLTGGSYRPEELLWDIAAQISPQDAIEGVHLFSFNQVEATIAWQHELARSGEVH